MVQFRECLVEPRESGFATSRELGQVGVSHLAMANDPLHGHIGIRQVVGPEFVPGAGGGLAEDRACLGGWLAFADEQPRQAALGDRAGREVAGRASEPVLGGRVVDVVVDEQGENSVSS